MQIDEKEYEKISAQCFAKFVEIMWKPETLDLSVKSCRTKVKFKISLRNLLKLWKVKFQIYLQNWLKNVKVGKFEVIY